MNNIIHAERLFQTIEYLDAMYPPEYQQYMTDIEACDFEIELMKLGRYHDQAVEQNRIISQRSCKLA